MKDIVIRTVCRVIVPFVQVYGLYVIFHGHLSPGGGFAGGAILGSSMVLFALSFHLEAGAQKLGHETSSYLESGGGIWYILIGLLGLALGSNFLTNRAAGLGFGLPGQLFSGGMIFLLSLGIGVKVASTMFTLFYNLSEEEGSGGDHQ